MRKVVVPNYDDPRNLFDIYDGDRITQDGDLHRVAEGVERGEVDLIWTSYAQGEEHARRTV